MQVEPGSTPASARPSSRGSSTEAQPAGRSARCAAMDCHKLADLIPLADNSRSFFTRIFQVLRCEAERCEGKDVSVVADNRVTVDHDMRVEPHTRAEHDLVADDREWSDVT